MPYAMCPQCGAKYHLSVSDVRSWYAERYPDLPSGSLVPGVCFYCFPDLKQGDAVAVRQPMEVNRGVAPGEKGIVKAILKSNDGSLYQVRLNDGKDCHFIRAELRKQRENE